MTKTQPESAGAMADDLKVETATDLFRSMLVRDKAVSEADLDRADRLARSEDVRLERILLRLGLIEETLLVKTLCAAFELPFVETTEDLALDPALAQDLSPAYLAQRLVVPVATADGMVTFLTPDPADPHLRRELEFLLGRPVDLGGATTATVRALLAEPAEKRAAAEQAALLARDQTRLRATEADGPVIRHVQELLTEAVLAGASDVHVESTETGISARFRINGQLSRRPVDPAIDPDALIARLKVMAELNVAERRLPQDGRFTIMAAGRTIDFRFSSLPTHWGESLVCRVLDPRALRLGWDRLGFPAGIADRIRGLIERPSGLFLVTGPTGSGKTTTLYTALAHLNTPGRKIVTVEDPVEYNIPGVQQVQVHEAIGLTFARVLRGILRHDPNVILVGEIRDEETAEIAARAAQVGRLVLSTLHTNSARGAVMRLADLGVPRFVLGEVLRGVLAQTLTPYPCSDCAGAGCRACGGSGIGGRRLEVELLAGEELEG